MRNYLLLCLWILCSCASEEKEKVNEFRDLSDEELLEKLDDFNDSRKLFRGSPEYEKVLADKRLIWETTDVYDYNGVDSLYYEITDSTIYVNHIFKASSSCGHYAPSIYIEEDAIYLRKKEIVNAELETMRKTGKLSYGKCECRCIYNFFLTVKIDPRKFKTIKYQGKVIKG